MAENEKSCALCDDEHDLQDSHLLPKHFYKYIDRMKKKGTKTQFNQSVWRRFVSNQFYLDVLNI